MWDSAGDTPDTGTSTTGVTTQLARTASSAEAEDVPEADPLPAAGGELAPSEGPGSGDAAAELPLKVTGTTLEITPDPALLRGEDTVFPLYIDPPTKGIALGDWTALASNGTKYWEFDGDKGVGRCSNYMRLPLRQHPVHPAHVLRVPALVDPRQEGPGRDDGGVPAVDVHLRSALV